MLIKWQRKLTTLKKSPLSKQNDIISTLLQNKCTCKSLWSCDGKSSETSCGLPVVHVY